MQGSFGRRKKCFFGSVLKREIWLIAFLLLLMSRAASAVDESKIIDLTYAFDRDTVYWPTAKPFTLERVAAGWTAAGFWLAANNISLAEHGGTHLDAPIHFAEGKWTTDEIPLEKLIGPATVIDVRGQASRDPDYRVTVEDIRRWENAHGRIPDGAIVLVLTGWGQFWPHKKKYLGTDKSGDVDHLRFPGFSRDVAEFLVNERVVDAVGIDTASLDYGQSKDFIVHQILSRANKPGLENVANLDRLPPKGATLMAFPMKIKGGSGGPTRIIAFLP